MILSKTVKIPSVPKNAAHIFAPAAIAAAVINEVPPPVTPPKTSTTMGADTMMEITAIIMVDINAFHQFSNML